VVGKSLHSYSCGFVYLSSKSLLTTRAASNPSLRTVLLRHGVQEALHDIFGLVLAQRRAGQVSCSPCGRGWRASGGTVSGSTPTWSSSTTTSRPSFRIWAGIYQGNEPPNIPYTRIKEGNANRRIPTRLNRETLSSLFIFQSIPTNKIITPPKLPRAL